MLACRRSASEIKKFEEAASAKSDALTATSEIISAFNSFKKGLRRCRTLGLIQTLNTPSKAEREDRYEPAMAKLQFKSVDLVDMVAARKASHRFHPFSTTIVGSKQARLLRIGSELSILSKSLPCNESSSIFLRVDDTRLDVMKVLITGPTDTPYSMGAFVFDVHLPPNYPTSPPKVLLTTTDQGRCRFNPNLYADGKVKGRASREATKAEETRSASCEL